MDSSRKGLIGWALVVAAIVGAAFLGVRFPIPEAPPETGLGALDACIMLDGMGNMVFGGDTYAATTPLTITGVLTDVQLLVSEGYK